MAKCKKLVSLQLAGTKITDAGLKEVAKLEKLTDLNLSFCDQITYAGLKEVAKLQQLTNLSLAHTPLTDGVLFQLPKMQQLRHLTLSGTQATKQGVAQLRKLLPKCKIYSRSLRPSP